MAKPKLRVRKEGGKPLERKIRHLGYMQREPPSRQHKIEKKDQKKLEKPKKPTKPENGGGYCGGGPCCGKESCSDCGERPRFVGIDYTRD
jgi:hypothetical protein